MQPATKLTAIDIIQILGRTNEGCLGDLSDARGAVRVEEVFDTDLDDLWDACTSLERLARWIVEIDGDAAIGDTF